MCSVEQFVVNKREAEMFVTGCGVCLHSKVFKLSKWGDAELQFGCGDVIVVNANLLAIIEDERRLVELVL